MKILEKIMSVNKNKKNMKNSEKMMNIQKWFNAIEMGDKATLQQMFNIGFDINTRDNQSWTGIMLSASLEDQEVVDLLVELGADLSLKNNQGKTIYDIANNITLPENTKKNTALATSTAKKQAQGTLKMTGSVQYSENSNLDSHWTKIKDERYDFKQGIEYIRNAFAESDYELYEQYIAVLNQMHTGFQKVANRNTPIKIAVSAETSAGKSTFLNALLFGKDVLETTFGETTKAVFEIAYGKKYGVIDADGNKQETDSIEEFSKLVLENSQKTQFGQKNMIQLFVPSPLLEQGIILYDTPGYSSVNEDKLLENILSCANQSDIVIFIVDISRGIKKSDMEIYKNVLFIPEHAEHCYLILNKLDAIAEQEEFEDTVFDGTNDEVQALITEDTIIQEHINKILNDMNKEVGLMFNRDNVIPLAARKFLNAPKSAYALLFKDFQEKINEDIQSNKNFLMSMRSDLPRMIAAQLINYVEKSFSSLHKRNNSFFKSYFPRIQQDFQEFMEEFMKDITTVLNLDLYDKDKTALRFAELDEVKNEDIAKIPFNIETIIWTKNTLLFKHIEGQWTKHISSSNNQRQTLLHHAVNTKVDEITKILLVHGANPFVQDAQSNTPLTIAIANKNETILTEIINRSMDFDILLWVQIYCLEFPKLTTLLFEKTLTDKIYTAELFCYAMSNNKELCNDLFERDINFDAPNKHGDTPIFIAVRTNNLDLVQKLVRKGVSVDSLSWRDKSPLLELALADKEILLYLLLQGANACFKMKNGQHFLIAVYERSPKLVEKVLIWYKKSSKGSQDLVRYFVDRKAYDIVQHITHLAENKKELFIKAIADKDQKMLGILQGGK